MFDWLLAFALTCGTPVRIDDSGLGWDDELAQRTLVRASYVCRTRYSGCLVRITRVNRTTFAAVCGGRGAAETPLSE